MKLFYFLLLGFLFPLFAIAQPHYLKGYVVLSRGDTVRGYINTREWEITPITIQFKVALNDKKIIRYEPTALLSFEALGVVKFVTYTGKVSMDPTDIGHLPSGIDTTTKRTSIFQQVLYDGPKVTLLSNEDNIKKRYFIQEAGQQPVELIFHQYYNTDELSSSKYPDVTTKDIYKGQLQYYAEKYNVSGAITARINQAKYRETDIEEILKLINKDKRSSTNLSASRFFVGGGIAFQDTKITGDEQITNLGHAYSVAPFLSLGYDYINNVKTQKLVLRGEVAVGYVAPRFSAPYYSYAPGVGTTKYNVNQFNFSLVPQLIYNFYSTDALRIYVDAGLALHLSAYTNNTYTVSSADLNTHGNYYKLSTYWASAPVKVGILLNNRLELYAIYNFPTDYSNNAGFFNISTSTVGVGAHYCFGKANKK